MQRDLLSSSRAGFRELVETIPDAIMLLDCERGLFVDGNRNALDILGLTREEFLGCGPADISPARQPDGRASDEAAAELVRRALDGEPVAFDWVHLHKSGRRIDAEVRLMRFRGEGAPLVCGCLMDVTARRAAERELRLTRHTVEQAHQAIMWVGADARVRYANDAACRSLGYDAAELLGMPLEVLDPDSAAWRAERIERMSRDGSLSFESRHRRKDGSDFPVEIHATLVEFDDERLTVNFVTDLTERRRAAEARRAGEEQLRHAYGLEAVGRLASGIAHDFNNLLTVIGGFAEFAQGELESGHAATEAVARIRDAVGQAEAVTSGLLTFARQERARREPVLLVEVAQLSHDLIARMLPAAIEVRLDLAGARDAWVEGDRDRLGQVLMNLALNARDAMPDGGTLTIAAHADDERVHIDVGDTGPGVPDELRGRIFEPYFTTKPRGKGTGLGLSVLHGIVETHGGTVELLPAEARTGATFRVSLSRCAAPGAAPGAAAREPARDVGRLRGRVLSVEDEPMVARIVARALEGRGLEVEQYADGEAALAAFDERPDGFDCFVLDHDLPGLSGVEVAQRVRAAGSRAPVLIVSGDPGVDVSGVADPVLLFPKPFRMGELASVVGAALAAASS